MHIEHEQLIPLNDNGKRVSEIIKLLEYNGMKAWDMDYHTITSYNGVSYKREKFNNLEEIMIVSKRHSFIERIMDEFNDNNELREVVGILNLSTLQLFVYGGDKIFKQYKRIIEKIDGILNNNLKVIIKRERWSTCVNSHGDWVFFDY